MKTRIRKIKYFYLMLGLFICCLILQINCVAAEESSLAGTPEEVIYVKNVLTNDKEIDFCKKCRKWIKDVRLVFAVLVLLVILLIIDNVKRRIVQNELSKSHEELTRTYVKLTISKEVLKKQYEIIQEHAKEVGDLYQKYDIAIQSTNSTIWEMVLDKDETGLSGNIIEIIRKSHKERILQDELLRSMVTADYWDKIKEKVYKCAMGEIKEIDIEVPISEDGKQRWILVRGKKIESSKHKSDKLSGIFIDITNMKNNEACIKYFVNHDYLTNLPNRMKFMKVLSAELEKQAAGAVILIDIDNFKKINVSQGHVYGDQLLKEVAERLCKIKDENMFCARLGGDEFLILITSFSDVDSINNYARRIMSTCDESFCSSGKENSIRFSMGISCYPEDSTDIDQLIMNADNAMYRAKRKGRNSFVYYRESMMKELNDKIMIENILHLAIKMDNFFLLYQPQVDVQTGKIVSFEALLRLKMSSMGPGVFIPVAEETGHIIEIGRWVAQEAIRQMACWRNQGYPKKVVAINFSSKQLRDTGYIEFLKDQLELYGIEANCIEIEITESALLENDVETLSFLDELKEIGCKIVLDDFGIGYSSLKYLTYINVDKIKLDKSISDKFLNMSNIKVMDSLISLVHSLNFQITAEGIEEVENYKKLKRGGCDYIQGYLFSKPISAEEAKNIFDTNMLESMKPQIKE